LLTALRARTSRRDTNKLTTSNSQSVIDPPPDDGVVVVALASADGAELPAALTLVTLK
jgi:hypothetical protein